MFKRFNRVDLGDGQEAIKKLNAYLPGIKREEMGDYFHFTSGGYCGESCTCLTYWNHRVAVQGLGRAVVLKGAQYE
jgi:hypothetical protein